MGIKPQIANEDINIDCYRGLGLCRMQPANIRKLPDDVAALKRLSREDIYMLSCMTIAQDFSYSFPDSSPITDENIILSKRASAAFYIAARYVNQKITHNDKKVLVLSPAYNLLAVPFAEQGWQVYRSSDFSEPKFKSNAARISEIRNIIKTQNIDVLCLNSPHNPLGEVYDQQFMLQMAELLNEFPNLRIFTDEVYEKLVPENVPSIFALADDNLRERIFLISGISKTVMPGDKGAAGWLITSASNVSEIRSLLDSGVISQINSHKMSEKRLLNIISAIDHTSQDHFEDLIAEFTSRKQIIGGLLQQNLPAQVKVIIPENLFFLMLDVSNLLEKGITTDDIVEKIADDYKIRILPSAKIGSDKYLRLSLGSVFVRDSFEQLDYVKDGVKDAFLPAYKDWQITSDMVVHQYIATSMCKVIKNLLRENNRFRDNDELEVLSK